MLIPSAEGTRSLASGRTDVVFREARATTTERDPPNSTPFVPSFTLRAPMPLAYTAYLSVKRFLPREGCLWIRQVQADHLRHTADDEPSFY